MPDLREQRKVWIWMNHRAWWERETIESERQHKLSLFFLIFSYVHTSDLGSQRVCPVGRSSEASCRARMETQRLYCAPITGGHGSHLQTGLRGLILWMQDHYRIQHLSSCLTLKLWRTPRPRTEKQESVSAPQTICDTLWPTLLTFS